MLFVIIVEPILINLVELLQVILENIKGKYALQIAKINKEVSELSQEEEEIKTSVIGFQMPDNTEEDDENYEEF